jgi:hypothetical protein
LSPLVRSDIDKWTAISNRQLDAELSRCGIATSAGMSYVKKMLDPFHTKDLPSVGIPDSFTGKSVVYSYEKEYNVDKPTSFAAGLWDAHIAFVPVISGVSANMCVSDISLGDATVTHNTVPTSASLIGPLAICMAPTGTNTFTASGTNTSQVIESLGFTEILTTNKVGVNFQGKWRVVGGAIKIVNTTSQLYKQGSVCSYRQSTDGTDGMYMGLSGDSTPVNGNYMLRVIPAPPIHVASASQLGGLTWDAAEGALLPLHVRPEEPKSPSSALQPAIVTTTAGFSLANSLRCFTQKAYVTAPTNNWSHIPIDADICGAYFTGLSEETTLTVKLFLTFEFFPCYNDTANLAIARQSPEYDPKALECYCHIMSLLPVAAKADENAAGDWLKRVGEAVKVVANNVAKVNANVVNPMLHSLGGSNPHDVSSLYSAG